MSEKRVRPCGTCLWLEKIIELTISEAITLLGEMQIHFLKIVNPIV